MVDAEGGFFSYGSWHGCAYSFKVHDKIGEQGESPTFLNSGTDPELKESPTFEGSINYLQSNLVTCVQNYDWAFLSVFASF